jgi:hypothetical protein
MCAQCRALEPAKGLEAQVYHLISLGGWKITAYIGHICITGCSLQPIYDSLGGWDNTSTRTSFNQPRWPEHYSLVQPTWLGSYNNVIDPVIYHRIHGVVDLDVKVPVEDTDRECEISHSLC